MPSYTFTSNLRKISMYMHIFSILKLPLNNFKCAIKYLCTRLSNHASFKHLLKHMNLFFFEVSMNEYIFKNVPFQVAGRVYYITNIYDMK